MYGDIIEDLREGLAVSAEHDRKISRGVEAAARLLLRDYNFRQAVRKSTAPIAALANTVPLPTDAGKVKAVRLVTVEGTSTLFKRLKRREQGILPTADGPNFYWTEGANIVLDAPMPEVLVTPYSVEFWYQSIDPAWAEAWLSEEFAEVIEHRAGYILAAKLRKPEASQLYLNFWQEDIARLAIYLNELEFEDMDLRMGEQSHRGQERYPAN